jgi:hypothetical protein
MNTTEMESAASCEGINIASSTVDYQVAPLYSFKIHDDNIDKDVRPSHMRTNRKTNSLHFFNAYAVRDRIDTSALQENHNIPQSLNFDDFLPTSDDYHALKEYFKTLIQRVLCEQMKFFKENFSGLVIHHIKHKYSEEMKKKSEIVMIFNIMILIKWIHTFFVRFLLVFC